MHPVPGWPVSTAFGIAGAHWAACGFHTGVDVAAPTGAPVVAARPGVVAYVSFGPAFGSRQLVVRADDGSQDFYAHLSQRNVQPGQRVQAGQRVGAVGAEGNATGPHLHLERHSQHTNHWGCAVIRDPAPSLNWEEAPMPITDEDARRIAREVWNFQIDNQPARWWQRMTHRIVARWLGPAGDAPSRTRQADIRADTNAIRQALPDARAMAALDVDQDDYGTDDPADEDQT